MGLSDFFVGFQVLISWHCSKKDLISLVGLMDCLLKHKTSSMNILQPPKVHAVPGSSLLLGQVKLTGFIPSCCLSLCLLHALLDAERVSHVPHQPV